MKKFLSVLLSLVLAFSAVSALSLCVNAEQVSEYAINIDMSKVHMNTAYTEYELYNAVNTTICSPDCDGISIKMCQVNYYDATAKTWRSLGNQQVPLSTDKLYGAYVSVAFDDGYEPTEVVKALSVKDYLISSCPVLKLKVNGEYRDDAWFYYYESGNQMRFYVPFPAVSDEPIIKEVQIGINNLSLGLGESYQLSAEAFGTADNKSIVWSISDAVSENTTIAADGTLTIGDDEEPGYKTVRASSEFDLNVYDEISVRVINEPAVITGVTVTPDTAEVVQKSYKQFTAQISGTQMEKSVTWSLEGNESDATVLNEYGKLYVAKDETAETLTVKATSNFDNTKFGIATVTVTPITILSEFAVEFDEAAFLLSADHTEGEVRTNIYDNSTILVPGSESTESYLGYLNGSTFNGIGNGTNQISLERTYYAEYYTELQEGYDWCDVILNSEYTAKPVSELEGFKVIANGEVVEDAYVSYNDYWNAVRVYIPIGPATEHDPVEPIVFPDVNEGDWFYDAVQYCAQKGFITGYKSGKFGPADALQRQDFVVILARIAGADLDAHTSCKLTDVDMTAYYGKAVAWAVGEEIIKGYDNGKFGVGDRITREQVATILYRYLGKPEVTDADGTLAKFPDKSSVSSFAKEALAWANQNSVINGKGDGTLAPTATASRAEIATIIMRMDQKGLFAE